MTRFEPLFRLNLVHDFHGSVRPPIAVIPDRATARFAAGPNLKLRNGSGWVEAYATDDQAMLQTEAGDTLVFTFRLRPHNPSLVSVTSGIAEARDKVFLVDLDVSGGDVETDERMVGEQDLFDLEPNELIEDRDILRPPLGIVRLRMDANAKDANVSLRFGAAERFWTYHVMGSGTSSSLVIRDKTDAISFEAIGERMMANGVVAQSFRSSAPIAARARPENRFELVSEGPFGPRVVLSTLPSPWPGPGRIEGSGRGKRTVSEVYLNLL
ncbi:MAG: hypothetical protein AAGG56_09370 [Pseudomonadota bacterium]